MGFSKEDLDLLMTHRDCIICKNLSHIGAWVDVHYCRVSEMPYSWDNENVYCVASDCDSFELDEDDPSCEDILWEAKNKED